MCAGHKPGLAELQTFYKFFFFFSISFFLITKIFQLFMMDLIKKKKKIRGLHSPQGLPRMITLICLHFFSDIITFLGAILCKLTA